MHAGDALDFLPLNDLGHITGLSFPFCTVGVWDSSSSHTIGSRDTVSLE